jgi:hypothetical protein
LLAGALALSSAIGGCAPDAWKPNPNFSAFLNKVEQNCGTSRIGELTVSQLMNSASGQFSAYFVDMTSRFETGGSRPKPHGGHRLDLHDDSPDTAGIRCIIAQQNP